MASNKVANFEGGSMLELCHSINSVWAQKVRIALAEKGLDYEDRLMTLRGDQFDPAHMKLNPNAIVPTPIAWWARVRERRRCRHRSSNA
jgi:hypothetical protein